MYRIIKVYGKLAKHLGQRSFKAAIKTPAEAIRFLLANFPDLKQVLSEGDYQVTVGRSQLEIANHPEHLHLPTAPVEAIRIVPVVSGAGAAGKILAGIGLIAASFLFPGAGIFGATSIFGGTAVAGGVLTGIGTISSMIGASLVLGGVAQLLSPMPKISQGADSANDPRKSYSFSGIQNVSRQGIPVPVIYGEVFTGSIVVSAGINTEEVTA